MRRGLPWFGRRWLGWRRRSGGLRRLLLEDIRRRGRRWSRQLFALGIDLLRQEGIFLQQGFLRPRALDTRDNGAEKKEGGEAPSCREEKTAPVPTPLQHALPMHGPHERVCHGKGEIHLGRSSVLRLGGPKASDRHSGLLHQWSRTWCVSRGRHDRSSRPAWIYGPSLQQRKSSKGSATSPRVDVRFNTREWRRIIALLVFPDRELYPGGVGSTLPRSPGGAAARDR